MKKDNSTELSIEEPQDRLIEFLRGVKQDVEIPDYRVKILKHSSVPNTEQALERLYKEYPQLKNNTEKMRRNAWYKGKIEEFVKCVIVNGNTKRNAIVAKVAANQYKIITADGIQQYVDGKNYENYSRTVGQKSIYFSKNKHTGKVEDISFTQKENGGYVFSSIGSIHDLDLSRLNIQDKQDLEKFGINEEDAILMRTIAQTDIKEGAEVARIEVEMLYRDKKDEKPTIIQYKINEKKNRVYEYDSEKGKYKFLTYDPLGKKEETLEEIEENLKKYGLTSPREQKIVELYRAENLEIPEEVTKIVQGLKQEIER